MPLVTVNFSKIVTVSRVLNLPDDKHIDLNDLEDYIQNNQSELDDEIFGDELNFGSKADDLLSEYVTIPPDRVGTETCIESIEFEGPSNGPPDVNPFDDEDDDDEDDWDEDDDDEEEEDDEEDED
jgi:hypothetical protein